jgi:hypothetical protein
MFDGLKRVVSVYAVVYIRDLMGVRNALIYWCVLFVANCAEFISGSLRLF